MSTLCLHLRNFSSIHAPQFSASALDFSPSPCISIDFSNNACGLSLLPHFTMSTLEELDDLDRRDKEDKKREDGDDKDKKKPSDGDAEMTDAAKEEDDFITNNILGLSTQDILTRKRLLENDSRIMKSELSRLSHEKAAMAEKIKDNVDKIANNRCVVVYSRC